MTDPRTFPSLSIIVEWENAERIGTARARQMLAALHTQLCELTPGLRSGCEIIVLHDPNKIPRDVPLGCIRAIGRSASWPAEFHFLGTAGGSYYQQKNAGAALAEGDLLIFLDSDVIPEPGWLKGVIQPFSSSDVDVVGGNTFVEHDDLYSKAIALVWFFPLRSTRTEIVPASNFYANNVAFRRAVFASHNFPLTGQFRGQCTALAEELTRNGYGIWLSQAAQVAHPPPAGVKAFLLRALWNGHDDSVGHELNRRSSVRGLKSIAARFLGAIAKVWHDRMRVGLGPAGAVAASAIAVLYYGLSLIAFLATLAMPGLVRRTLSRADGR
jgi:hypothetical protein